MRRDAARNRQLLIEAAHDVFARRGLEATLDEIARQAGVGIGTAYRHFGNKHDLAAAVTEAALANVLDIADKAAVAEDPWDGLVGFMQNTLELQIRDRGLREVMMGQRNAQQKIEFHEQLSIPVEAMLARCKDAGAVREDAAMSDLGFVVMMLCQVADLAGDTDPNLWRRYLPTLLGGLVPGGPPLDGVPLTDEQYRAATASYLSCRLDGRSAAADPA